MTTVFRILFILVIAAGGTAGWLGWKYLQRVEQKTSDLQQQLSAQQGAETKINQARELENKTLQEQVQRVLKQQEQEQNPAYSKTYYHLLEADYMARLAALNLSFGPNVPAAIALLQNADQRIKEAEDPNLNKIRQSLAESILSLQGVPPVDTAGLLTRLTAIQEQVKHLPLFGVDAGMVREPQIHEPILTIDENEKRWKRALKETWNTLQKIIIIRHRNQPVAPLITPEQEIYLRQNLHVLLQQAQWGVIQNNSAVYQTSLQQAIDWLQQYFANNEPTTQATLTILANLQKVNVQPDLPDISGTLKLLTDTLHGDNKPMEAKQP